jgi:uncharacterized coiled-coil protein SlyX
MTTATQENAIPESKLEHISINLFGYGDREAPIHEVEHRLTTQRETIERLNREISTMRENVRSALHKFDKKTDTVELDLEDVNSILEDIGASKILFTYTATVTYTVTITGIEADSESEAERKALNAVDCRVDEEKCGEDAQVDNEEYEATDVEEEDN